MFQASVGSVQGMAELGNGGFRRLGVYGVSFFFGFSVCVCVCVCSVLAGSLETIFGHHVHVLVG